MGFCLRCIAPREQWVLCINIEAILDSQSLFDIHYDHFGQFFYLDFYTYCVCTNMDFKMWINRKLYYLRIISRQFIGRNVKHWELFSLDVSEKRYNWRQRWDLTIPVGFNNSGVIWWFQWISFQCVLKWLTVNWINSLSRN